MISRLWPRRRDTSHTIKPLNKLEPYPFCSHHYQLQACQHYHNIFCRLSVDLYLSLRQLRFLKNAEIPLMISYFWGKLVQSSVHCHKYGFRQLSCLRKNEAPGLELRFEHNHLCTAIKNFTFTRLFYAPISRLQCTGESLKLDFFTRAWQWQRHGLLRKRTFVFSGSTRQNWWRFQKCQPSN